MAAISLHAVRRVHPDGTAALAGVDLAVADGELLGVIGPSGAGKSTLLRVIAGLEPLSTGTVRIGGTDVSQLATRSREVALIAQSQNLYSFLDVAANLAFPLELRRTDRAEVDRRTGAERDAFGLRRIWRRRPSQLSAGDAQRTALARAMVRLPRVLLADEPLQLLDPPTAIRLRNEIRKLQRATAMTTIWTTNEHDQVLGIADRIAVLRAGRIVQVGTAAELLTHPGTMWVAGFVGEPAMTFVEVGVEEHAGLGQVRTGDQVVRFPGGLPGPLRQRAGGRVTIGGRPGHIRSPRAEDPVDSHLSGVAIEVRTLGHADHVVVDVGSGRLTAAFPPSSGTRTGDRVAAHLSLRQMSAFDIDSGAAIWHGG